MYSKQLSPRCYLQRGRHPTGWFTMSHSVRAAAQSQTLTLKPWDLAIIEEK